MGLFSTAKLFGMTIRESATDGSDFTNPDADYRRLFLGEDGALHLKDSAGTVTAVSGGTPAFVGCRAYNDGTQSISDTTITAVTFGAENFDTNTIHDTGSNTSRFTVPTTGKWRFTGGTSWDTNTLNARYLWWRIDGTTEVNGGAVQMAPNATNLAMQTTVTLSLTSGQYVELMVYQTSGSPRTIGGTDADKKFESFVECHYLGA